MIGKSDMLSFYGTEKNIMLRAQRTVRNEEDKTLFTLDCSTESFVLVFCQTSWHNLKGLSTLHSHSFSWKQVQEREDWGGSTTGPGAAETAAASFMGSGVSGSHERSIRFRLRHSWMSSAARKLPLRSSPECLSSSSLSPSSSVFVFAVPVFLCLRLRVFVFVCLRLRLSPSSSVPVFVCLRRSARCLVQRASAVCPIFYIEGLETTVACAF